jgi:hypothetical protein
MHRAAAWVADSYGRAGEDYRSTFNGAELLLASRRSTAVTLQVAVKPSLQ